jgi:putative flippase GtrA
VLDSESVRSSVWTTARSLFDDRRVRYVLTGGGAAVVYFVAFSVMWLLLSGHVHYDLVALAANAFTAVSTYPLYRRYVFQSNVRWIRGFTRFYLISLASLLTSLVGLPLLIEVAHVPVLISQAVLIGLVPLINYQVHRFWTFRHRSAANPEA